MALAIKDKKVVTIVPPKKLSDSQRERLIAARVDDKLIQRATSRKYNIVYK